MFENTIVRSAQRHQQDQTHCHQDKLLHEEVKTVSITDFSFWNGCGIDHDQSEKGHDQNRDEKNPIWFQSLCHYC